MQVGDVMGHDRKNAKNDGRALCAKRHGLVFSTSLRPLRSLRSLYYTTNPKNPLDLRRFSLGCQLRGCVGVGISCGDQCGDDDDAPPVGEVITVGAGDFADRAVRAQQGELARHRGGVAALVLLREMDIVIPTVERIDSPTSWPAQAGHPRLS